MVLQILVVVVMLYFVCSVAAAAGTIDIGSRLEPFVDDYLIDRVKGARLMLQEPTPMEVSIVHNKPWEGNTCFYHTVFQDDDVCRMYYRGSHYDEKKGSMPHQVVCYAESKDGIRWKKPNLGIVEFKGSKKNNIIWAGVGTHNFAPFKDPNPKCKPSEKYKALAGGNGGLVPFKSADGINWKLMRKKPVITKGAFDSQNLAFWDTERKKYVDFHRGFQKGVRAIMTCTSKDFLTWTNPVYLKYVDAPNEHLYTNQITQYYRAPHIFMGFPKRFAPSRRVEGHRLPGVSDGVFMTSRDGKTFHRWTEALIRPGLQEERWVCRNNMIAWGIIETQPAFPGLPSELSIYSIEGYYEGKSCQMRRFTLRIDGFVSLHAPYKGGEMLTKPLKFAGNELVINYATSAAGSVRVEIRDAKGKPIPGYSLRECPEIFGDEIEHVVAWKKGSDVSKLAGKPVRLRFVMKDADVYSLRFGG